MVTTTDETCNGNCMDAAMVHNVDIQTNENGATYCTRYCREKRFEQRCHCGKKYMTKPEASDAQKELSKQILQNVRGSRDDLAERIAVPFNDIMVIIRNVDHDTFSGLELPMEEISPNGTLRKRYTSSLVANDMGISFWRAPS